MDSELTEIEKKLFQFRSISSSLGLFLGFCFKSNDNRGSTIAMKYGTLELAHFIKYYESLMGNLDERQRKLVLCLSPYIKNIMDIKLQINHMRNNWVGHINENSKSIKDFSMDHNNPGMPENISDYYIFYIGVRLFTKKLFQILSDDNISLNQKLAKNITSFDIHLFDCDEIERKINDMKQKVDENLKKNNTQ